MKINWKNRFKNKVTLVAICAQVLAIIYMFCNMFGIQLPVAQETIMEFVMLVIGLLVLLGIVVDPNTPGVNDGTQQHD